MQNQSHEVISKKRPINLSIRESLIKEAKALNLNTSEAAEYGISQAIKQARSNAWLQENAAALSAHNQRIETQGTLLTPKWAKDQ